METNQNQTGQDEAVVAESCQEDRQALQRAIEDRLKILFTESLDCLEQALPHKRGDGSPNSHLFMTLRRRILNCGNGTAREVQALLDCFQVKQVFERRTEKHVMARQGPHGLPVGVQMPPGKTAAKGDSE